MIINWYGEGCFKIQTGGTTILTDPFSAKGGSASGGESIGVGLTPPRFKAEIVLRTANEFPKNSSTHELIGPGEYEAKGIEIFGWPLEKNKTAYLVKAEGMTLGFLGHISEKPDAEILEKLGEVDLLFIPAGGEPFISQESAAKLIKQIQPKVVVASFFKTPGLKRKTDDIKAFLKETEKKAESQEKLTIKKKDLPDKLTVVVLRV